MKKIILSLAIAISVIGIGAQVNAQVIRTIAGVDTIGHTGDGGPAIHAQIGASWSTVQDTAGNIYLADDEYNMIRKITPQGIITTIAGTPYSYGGYTGDGGPATAARLNYPSGMAFDRRGNLYFADNANFAIRKISPAGIITTFAGDGSGAHAHTGDGGPATAARMMGCVYVAVDRIGNVFFTDGNTRIRKVDTAGTITTIAGTSAVGYYGNGVAATSAALSGPCGIVVDSFGNIFFSDQNNGLIRKINTSGIISNYAGIPGAVGFTGDGGQATSAKIHTPGGLAVDNNGNVYFADESNGRIRRVTSSGVISTIAGSGSWSYSGDGGAPTSAGFKYPTSVCLGNNNNIFITDRRNYVVREIRNQSAVTITPSTGSNICAGTTNVFSVPERNHDLGLVHEWRLNGSLVGTDSMRYATSTLNNGDVISYKLVDPLGHFTIDSCNGITITVNPVLAPSVTVTKTTADTVCTGTSVTYLAHPVNGGTTPAYQWRVNGAAAGTGNTFGYSPANGDIVNVVLTSSIPCPTTNPVNSSNTNMTVRVTLTPAVNIAGATSTICTGTAVTYTAMGINGGTSPTYNWKKFGVNVGTGMTYTYTPSNGDYLTCQMISNATCASVDTVTNSAILTVNPNVSPSVNVVSVPVDKVAFPGQLVTFYSEVTYGGSGVTYQWYENGSLIAGATSATYSKNIFTDDSVKCIITSSLPCTDNPTPVSNTVVIKADYLDVNGISISGNNMGLYPNPNNGSFMLNGTIGAKNDKEVSYQVYNVTGRLITEGKVTTQQQAIHEQINLGNDVEPGQYILKINCANDYKLINFVVAK
jgi:hypothetical protein